MTPMNLIKVIGDVDESYVLSALETRDGQAKKKKRISLSRSLLIAALIALMLLLVGCAVAYVMSLHDMKIGEYSYIVPKHLDENGNKVYETEVTRNALSLQGYAGTPGYLANKEWYEFCETYTYPEDQEEIPMEDRLDYLSYGCYFPEQIAKVDEICKKYGLNTLGHEWIEDIPTTFDALGIDGLVFPDSSFQVDYRENQCYYYSDGTFDIGFTITFVGETPTWPEPIYLRMRYVQKASFDGVYGQMGPIESYTQWEYTTAQGVTALLAISEEDARIIVDQENAFLTVHTIDFDTPTGKGTPYLPREVWEAVAEIIDLAVVPGKVDVEAAQERENIRQEQAQAALEAEMETYVDPYSLESYQQYANYVIDRTNNPKSLMYGRNPDDFFYAIWDLDGDGTEDFLWGGNGELFSEAVTLQDGKIKLLYNVGVEWCLCENNIIEQSFDHLDSPTGFYTYIQFESGNIGNAKEICRIEFDRETGTWKQPIYDEWGSWEEITEEEAMAIIHSYKRLEFDKKPIMEFAKG